MTTAYRRLAFEREVDWEIRKAGRGRGKVRQNKIGRARWHRGRTWPHGRSRGRRGRRELEVPALLLLLTTSIYNDNSAVVDIAADGALAPSAGVGKGRNALKYGPLIVTVSSSVGRSVRYNRVESSKDAFSLSPRR